MEGAVPRLLAMLLSTAALAVGCSVSHPPAHERLGTLGEELVPAGSELVETDEGSCPQISGNPSCARIFYVADGPAEERADALEAAARAAGWDVVSRERRSDGILVELGREGYRAFAAVWDEERALPCLKEPDTDCADELQLIEDV
jgi:hypothetical protein